MFWQRGILADGRLKSTLLFESSIFLFNWRCRFNSQEYTFGFKGKKKSIKIPVFLCTGK